MAPAKAKGRAIVAQSDYETDFNANEALSVPPPPRRTNEELNLAVIRRYVDPVVSILSIASYSVIYTFSPDSQGWEKTGVEGTLFVAQLTPSPTGSARFMVIVLNRRGIDNFTCELKSGDDVELTDEYVILQREETDGSLGIYGLWIFAEPPPSSTATTRDINARMIKECARMAETSRKAMEAMSAAQMEVEASDEELQSVPMGRQLSLRELFGKQREQDAGFSIHHHATPQIPLPGALPHFPNFQQPQAAVQVQAQANVPKASATQKQATQVPAQPTKPQFANNSDTEFFLSAPKGTPTGPKGTPKQGRKNHPPRRNSPRHRNSPRNSPPRGNTPKQGSLSSQQQQAASVSQSKKAETPSEQPKKAKPFHLPDHMTSMTADQMYPVWSKAGKDGYTEFICPEGKYGFEQFDWMKLSDAVRFARNSAAAAKRTEKITYEGVFIPTVNGRPNKKKSVSVKLTN